MLPRALLQIMIDFVTPDTLPARWLPFDGYAISTGGTVWSSKRRTLKPLKGRPNAKGYLRVTLGAEREDRYIHRLMVETWVGPIPDGEEVRHVNGKPADNWLSNLTTGTPVQNAADKILHGTVMFGENHTNTKLTEALVIRARQMWKEHLSLDEIVATLALVVNRGTLHEAVTGLTWTRLDEIESPFKPGRW
jgi:hypothetical protein